MSDGGPDSAETHSYTNSILINRRSGSLPLQQTHESAQVYGKALNATWHLAVKDSPESTRADDLVWFQQTWQSNKRQTDRYVWRGSLCTPPSSASPFISSFSFCPSSPFGVIERAAAGCSSRATRGSSVSLRACCIHASLASHAYGQRQMKCASPNLDVSQLPILQKEKKKKKERKGRKMAAWQSSAKARGESL